MALISCFMVASVASRLAASAEREPPCARAGAGSAAKASATASAAQALRRRVLRACRSRALSCMTLSWIAELHSTRRSRVSGIECPQHLVHGQEDRDPDQPDQCTEHRDA